MIPILAVDPGTSDSAYVIWDGKKILAHGKVPNTILRNMLLTARADHYVVIEMIRSYGMAVGESTFSTVLWIGRFIETVFPHPVDLIYRQEVKLHFCHQVKAKDSNIRQALIDRFGEPGKKASPGLTFGLKADTWQAFALAVYAWDMQLMEGV